MTQHTDVLCAGLVVADHVCAPIDHLPIAGELVISDRMLLTPGGSAANTAVDLAKLGLGAAVVGRIGDDPFGRIVADRLREAAVDISELRLCAGEDTGQALIVNVRDQDRRFIASFGANAQFRAADIPLERVKHCRVFYLGGYLLLPKMRPQELIEILSTARQSRARTVLDVAIPGPGDYLPALEPLLPYVDVFLPNKDETDHITGESDVFVQAERFHRLGAKTVVITRGGAGSVLVNDTLRLRVGVYPVEYVDGSGGGDAFDAGYIYGLLNHLETEDCLRYAAAMGASCVRAVGTTPGVFTRAECEAFLKQHTLSIERL